MSRKRTRILGRRDAGFTLVEVAVVVVCVSIIASLALVGYRRYRQNARMSEATGLITTIKTEQEQHKSESGLYAQVSNGIDTYYPAAVPGKFATAWGGPCGNCINPNAWEKLGVKATAPVVYGYATVAGVGADVGTSSGSAPSATAPSGDDDGTSSGNSSNACTQIAPTAPYYLIQAQGDTDGDGVATTILGLSCSNSLVITNSGE